MRRLILSLGILVLATAILVEPLQGQNGSMRVTVPSPTAASLGRFGDVPVSLATGIPNVNVPLFTAKGRTLELPISLSYHAGGVRVEEIGGWVGLGWALNAGGSITRTVRGVPDEAPNGYINTGDVFYRYGQQTNPSDTLLDNIAIGSVDGDPDQFFFNVAGLSGQFAMGPLDSLGTFGVRTTPYQNLRIEASSGLDTLTITSGDGTRYTFAAQETHSDISETFIIDGDNPIPETIGTEHVSAWHLSRILAPGGDSVSFYYTEFEATHEFGTYQEDFKLRVGGVGGQCVPQGIRNSTEYEVDGQRLDSIKSAAHTVRFHSSLRTDAREPTSNDQQEYRLDSLSVETPGGALLKTFTLDYDYTGGRLRLNQVQEKGHDGTLLPPHEFDYAGTGLPAVDSYAQDHWGFYNGATSNADLIPTVPSPISGIFEGADRDPDLDYADMGALTTITYPTGGFTEFVYELNDYGGIGSGAVVPRVLGQTQFESVQANGFQGLKTENFTIGDTLDVIVKVTVTLDPDDCGEMFGCPYVEIVGEGTWHEEGVFYLTLSPDTYTMRANDDWTDQFARIAVSWQEEVPITEVAGLPGKPAGGLRIKEVRTSDGMAGAGGETEMVRQYRYVLQSDTTLSSGVVSQEPSYTHFFSIPGCEYYSVSSASRLPLGDGAPVSYREVTVLHGENGESGSTRHTFRSVLDAADPDNPSPWPSARRTSRAWKRGQERGAEVYDAGGDPQRRTVSEYAFLINDSIASHRFPGVSLKTVNVGGGASGWMYGPFDVESGWTHMVWDSTVTYNTAGGSPVATSTTYTYDNPLHAQPTQIVELDSDGDQWITRMKYPDDYASGGSGTAAQAITAMQSDGSAFMPATVIERWIAEDDGSETIHRGSLTTFKDWGAGKILPHETFVLDNDGPLASFTPSSVSGSFTKDGDYIRNESVYAYDGFGRPTRIDDARGERTDFSYGGNPNDAFLTEVEQYDNGSPALTTTYTYGTRGMLSSATDPGGATTSYEYDDLQRLETVKNDGDDVVRTVSYPYGRSTGGGALTTANAVVTVDYLTASDSLEMHAYFDGMGRPVQTISRGDSASWFVTRGTQYDQQGRVWREMNPYVRGSEVFDSAMVDSATAYWKDQLGLGGMTAARPYTETLYAPDPLARPLLTFRPFVGSTPPDSVLHEYFNNQTSNFTCSKATDEVGHTTQSCDDVFGNLSWEKANYAETDYLTNKFGEVLQTTDPRDLDSDYSYSTRGLLYQKETPDAGVTKYAYDAAGNLRFVQDANQAVAGTVTFTTYDFASRPLEAGQGTATWGSLNPAGSNTVETTTANWDQVWAYDAKPAPDSVPWSLFSTEIGSVTLANVDGRLAAVASKSNGSWQLALFSYDDDGQVSAQHTFTHANGGTSVATALNTTVEYTRDLQGAVTEKNVTIGSETFNQWFDYDQGGRLWKVFASAGATKPDTADVLYSYGPDGQLATREFKNDVEVPHSYTIRGALEAIGDPMTTTHPFSASYLYNEDGTVERATFYNAAGKQWHNRNRYDFTYDGRKRLTSSLYGNWNWSTLEWSSGYSETERDIWYDLSGNIQHIHRYRDSSVEVDNVNYTYATDSNRLLSISDAVSTTGESWDLESGTFTYDSVGNVLTAPAPYGLTAATYDRRNLPTSQTANSVTSTYRYDGSGQRISKQVGSGDTEYYILEGPLTLGVFTLDGSDSVTAWHFNLEAGGAVVGRETDAGDRYYYHKDLLGSTRTVMDDEGTAAEGYFYYPFGLLSENLSPNTGGTKEGFTGKEVDAESGLQYFGARYYMPALTRWGQVDPLADSFPSWTSYNYVLGNPVGLVDPDGRAPIPQIIGGILGLAVEGASQLATGQGSLTKLITAGGLGAASGGLSAVRAAKPLAKGLRMLGQGLLGGAAGAATGGSPQDVATGAFFGGAGQAASDIVGVVARSRAGQDAVGEFLDALTGKLARDATSVEEAAGVIRGATTLIDNADAALAGTVVGAIQVEVGNEKEESH